jgi:hypothetical protein
MLRIILQKCVLILVLASFAVLPSLPAVAASEAQQPKSPEGPPPGDIKWPDWLEETGKRLDKAKKITQPGPEIEFLCSRASELLEKARQSRDNYFRSGRFIFAANAMLDAGDRILLVRKLERGSQEKDYYGGIGMFLQGCAFRVRQADFFGSLIGEKYADQYIAWSKNFYQQARTAYEAHEYRKASLLGEASLSILWALECIAQTTIPSDAPITK